MPYESEVDVFAPVVAYTQRGRVVDVDLVESGARVRVEVAPVPALAKFWPDGETRRSFVVSSPGWWSRANDWRIATLARARRAQECDAIAQRLRVYEVWPKLLAEASETIGPMDYGRWTAAQSVKWLRFLRGEELARTDTKEGRAAWLAKCKRDR